MTFQDLMRRLKGWKSRGTCPACGLNGADRVIIAWTKEHVSQNGEEFEGWPAVDVCFHCGSSELDRQLIAYTRQQARQLVAALAGEKP